MIAHATEPNGMSQADVNILSQSYKISQNDQRMLYLAPREMYIGS